MAEQLRVAGLAAQHQCSSDSLLSGAVYFAMLDTYFDGILDDLKYSGFVYGLAAR